ncbi:12747_t:CDS:2, partial [Racocetra fulgida]
MRFELEESEWYRLEKGTSPWMSLLTPVNFVIPANEFTQIDDEILEEEDLNSLPTVPVSDEYFTVDYHIIYSTSYKVPVLYFNAYNS